MKNTLKLIVSTIFILTGVLSFGQSLNFSGGYTMSTLKSEYIKKVEELSASSNNSFKYKNVNGVNFTIGGEFILGERISLEVGVKYQTRGVKLEFEQNYDSGVDYYKLVGESKTKMSYIDLPIVLNTAITNGDFRVYGRTGIYMGLLINGKLSQRFESESSYGENEIYTDFMKLTTKEKRDLGINPGLVIGLGAEYEGFYFETNYNIGVLSLKAIDSKFFTHDVSFCLGYKIKVNK